MPLQRAIFVLASPASLRVAANPNHRDNRVPVVPMSVTAAFPGKAAFVSVDADKLALQAWEPRTLADIPTTGLGEADVHVWLLPLQQPPHTLEDLATSLTAEELARSSRFHLERDRKRFIAARSLLRHAQIPQLPNRPSATG